MNCKAMEKILIEYLDGRLGAREKGAAEAHLEACGACRRRAREFGELWGILEQQPALLPTAGFDAAVRARIAQQGQRWNLWGWLAPSPRLAVAVMALLAVSIWLSSLPRNLQPQPAPVAMASDAEFHMIANLPVLENYDVLANFEVLSELPVQAAAQHSEPGM